MFQLPYTIVIVLIILGGFFGATLRYILGEWLLNSEGFPVGTLFVNLLGCFCLGWFITYGIEKFKKNSIWLPFLGTGGIGSFTTFSTFSLETFYLILEKEYSYAILYVFASILIGLFLTFLGYKMAINQINKDGQPL